jgi:hypothetical protein
MPWRTYTPDGRTLDVDYADGTWVASCDAGQGVGKTAAEAIAQSLGEGSTPIGGPGSSRRRCSSSSSATASSGQARAMTRPSAAAR